MPNLRLEVIVPKEGIADVPRLMRVVESSLNEAADGVKMQFNRTTLSWKERPEFVIESRPGERSIYTTNKIYRFVSGGTRVRRVVMTKGFKSKSHPGSMYSGVGRGGVAFGPSMKIARPGIEARKFDEQVQKRWQKELPTQLQRAIDTEFRK